MDDEYRVVFSERRAVNQLCYYWNSLRGNRDYPEVSEIEYEEIMDIMENCFVVNVDSAYLLKYVGANIVNSYEYADIDGIADCDSKEVCRLLTPVFLEDFSEYFDEVVESGNPMVYESEVQNEGGFFLSRRCVLPLGSSGKVTDIIGAVGYRRA